LFIAFAKVEAWTKGDYVADEQATSDTNPQAETPKSKGKGPLPARGTIASENVSWEEKRKGMGPQTPEGVDEEFYNERFTSERQRVDRASTRWEVLDREGPSASAPNWPPALRP
jgi:hypothetical protein